ncbi:MAG: hypothetical protein WC390_07235 [Sulfurimonas sp.]|jgi:hypothetical protein
MAKEKIKTDSEKLKELMKWVKKTYIPFYKKDNIWINKYYPKARNAVKTIPPPPPPPVPPIPIG